MAKIKGLSFLMYVGAVPAAISGERDASMVINHAPADASDKGSIFNTSLAGRVDWSVSSSGVVVVDDASLAAIYSAVLDGSQVAVKMRDIEEKVSLIFTKFYSRYFVMVTNSKLLHSKYLSYYLLCFFNSL